MAKMLKFLTIVDFFLFCLFVSLFIFFMALINNVISLLKKIQATCFSPNSNS